MTDARLSSGLTQVQAAKALRKSQSWIARLESGGRKISVGEFLVLARLYRCKPGKLLDGVSVD